MVVTDSPIAFNAHYSQTAAELYARTGGNLSFLQPPGASNSPPEMARMIRTPPAAGTDPSQNAYASLHTTYETSPTSYGFLQNTHALIQNDYASLHNAYGLPSNSQTSLQNSYASTQNPFPSLLDSYASTQNSYAISQLRRPQQQTDRNPDRHFHPYLRGDTSPTCGSASSYIQHASKLYSQQKGMCYEDDSENDLETTPVESIGEFAAEIENKVRPNNEFRISCEDFPALPEFDIQSQDFAPSAEQQTRDKTESQPVETYGLLSFLEKLRVRHSEANQGSDHTNMIDVDEEMSKIHSVDRCRMKAAQREVQMPMLNGRPMPITGISTNLENCCKPDVHREYGTALSRGAYLEQPFDDYDCGCSVDSAHWPACYYFFPERHGQQMPEAYSKLTKDIKPKYYPTIHRLKEDLLFFLFYYFPGEINQLLAADALFTKKWVYNKRIHRWAKPEDNFEVVHNHVYRGPFTVFDPVTWRQTTQTFEFRMDDFEHEPTSVPLPFTARCNP